ncbi:MAG: GNAT family N-acetyltransferase [Myxococcaceae bacterium]
MSLRLKVLESISDVKADEWRALVGPSPVPSLRYEWLRAMEDSGSATLESGWVPKHFTLWRGAQLVGASPAYEKHHSMGEYIYDFAWAHAAAQMRVRYHPKLLVGAPLSPLTAPRFLSAPGEDPDEIRRELSKHFLEMAKDAGYSSVHVLFPPEETADVLEKSGWAHRFTMQYHWRNPGYRSYDDFLSRFSSKRRNQLKRERAAAADQGITIRTRRGEELRPEDGELAWKLYEITNEKNAWGNIQLNRDFFRRVFATMRDSAEVVEAVKGKKVVGGAFNLTANNKLYGRYWGCFEEHPFLHFNVCMYHSIAECIELGRTVFEPGAGGEHKISRGFEPTAIHSAHHIFHPKLDAAIRNFLVREREQVEEVVTQSAQISGMKPWEGPK